MRVVIKGTAASIGALFVTCAVWAAPFDGEWNGNLRCRASALNQLPAFSNPIAMVVAGDAAKLTRDTNVVTESLTGKIARSGQASLSGSGKFKAKEGTWTIKIDGKFSENLFNGNGLIYNQKGDKARECSAELTKVVTEASKTSQSKTKSMSPAIKPPIVAAVAPTEMPAMPSSPEQLLRGVNEIARQRGAPQILPTSQPANAANLGMVGAVPETEVAYRTQKELLTATLRGDLATLGSGSGEDRQQFVNSVLCILRREYGVPPLPENCAYWFASDVYNLFALVTSAEVGILSDKAPEFFNEQSDTHAKVQEINDRLAKLQSPRDPTACDSRVMGKVVPHPYRTTLPKLLGEYAKTTQTYVNTEHAARKHAYQESAAKQQAAERERQTEARAIEQKHIDAEAARIRLEQQQRAQQDKARVGG